MVKLVFCEKGSRLMSNLLSKNEINIVLDSLQSNHPNVKCGLDYSTSLELTLSLILAAQCTDKRVNIIRPILTEKFPTWEKLSKASFEEIHNIIRSCSFPNNKAKHIIACSQTVMQKYNGLLPDTMSELVKLPRYWSQIC